MAHIKDCDVLSPLVGLSASPVTHKHTQALHSQMVGLLCYMRREFIFNPSAPCVFSSFLLTSPFVDTI